MGKVGVGQRERALPAVRELLVTGWQKSRAAAVFTAARRRTTEYVNLQYEVNKRKLKMAMLISTCSCLGSLMVATTTLRRGVVYSISVQYVSNSQASTAVGNCDCICRHKNLRAHTNDDVGAASVT